MKKSTMRCFSMALVIMAGIVISGCTTTYAGRWVRWNFSGIDDHERFAALPIASGSAVFPFATAGEPPAIVIDVRRRGRIESLGLADLARSTATTALIVIRRDTVLFEGYFGGYDRESINTSFSVAKSITSLLVGMAIDAGSIESITDPITRYVPELLARDPRFGRLTIEQLLDMRSGLRWRDHDFITGDKPRAYYHPHLRKVVLDEIGFTHEPGERWVYNSYNPILLGIVLERSTGRRVSELLEDGIWKRIGMEFAASWSVDGAREPMEKMESGVNARAIDFAKIGRLILRQGDWEGDRVIATEWIELSTTIEPGCEIEAYRPRAICYRRAWWLHPPAEDRAFAVSAWGHLGQYIYVFPEQELVMVRFGRKLGGVSWAEVFHAIAAQIGDAACDFDVSESPRATGTEPASDQPGCLREIIRSG